MCEPTAPTATEPYDAIVVGAGLCGVIFLKYALEKGLRCLALEKQSGLGGVWRTLPKWQDIQNRKADFAINDIPLDGVKQPDVLRWVHRWVDTYDLAASIKLDHEVTSVARDDGVWRVCTNKGTFRARYLIVASGVQNRPWIPDVERSESEILEIHSSRVRRPEDLADRRVTVVGGGTSAWDLLDLALENDARSVDWVYRSTKWCMPTTRPKHAFWPNLREMAVVQTVTGSTEATSAFLRWLTHRFYAHHDVTEIEPDERLDIRKHQLIPGRARMIRDFDAISRRRSEVRRLRGHQVTLEDGGSFETDVILWGTGYRMELDYLGLPEYREIEKLDELRPRLGSLIRSRDHPDLFFIGMSLIDSTSATPFFAAIEARTTVAHILGRCTVPEENIPHHVVHWDLFRYFASFDRASYPRFWWRLEYLALALGYGVLQRKQVSI